MRFNLSNFTNLLLIEGSTKNFKKISTTSCNMRPITTLVFIVLLLLSTTYFTESKLIPNIKFQSVRAFNVTNLTLEKTPKIDNTNRDYLSLKAKWFSQLSITLKSDQPVSYYIVTDEEYQKVKNGQTFQWISSRLGVPSNIPVQLGLSSKSPLSTSFQDDYKTSRIHLVICPEQSTTTSVQVTNQYFAVEVLIPKLIIGSIIGGGALLLILLAVGLIACCACTCYCCCYRKSSNSDIVALNSEKVPLRTSNSTYYKRRYSDKYEI
jgi:hypothetical protein